MAALMSGPGLALGRARHTFAATTRARAPLTAARGPRHLQVACALQDPWATLGVPRDACEKEIKKAHRQLVKQHHPDVHKGDDPLAHARFMRVQEAYELIMGKRQGKDIEGRPANQGGWSFHDWYWKFSMRRRKTGPGGDSEPPPSPAGFRQQWQAQMAGLKQKAAAKAQQGRQRRPTPGAAAAAAAAGAGAATGPASSSAGREKAWRSMTKNANNTQKAAAQQAAAAAAAQKLGQAAANTARAVSASAQHPQPQQEQEQELRHPSAAAAEPAVTAAPMHHAAQAAADAEQEQQRHVAGAAAGAGAGEHASAAGGAHAERLHRLLGQAAAAVQGLQQEAGRHLRGRMTLQQLASLLDGRRHMAAPNADNNAVPADSQLHKHFEATRLRRQQEQEQQQAAAAAAAATAAEQGQLGLQEEAEHHEQQQYHAHGAAHARKFANRADVEGRLSSQLAGLKRRAALKQEVEANC